jgi:hypothetical protein
MKGTDVRMLIGLVGWAVVVAGAGGGLAVRAAEPAAEEPFDYFVNSWNVIGLKDYPDGTRVTPANELVLADGAKGVVRFGKERTPLSRKQTKTLMDGWMPILLMTAREGDVAYEFTMWATPLPTVKDWEKAFDWPTEGDNYLNWISVKVTNGGTGPAEAKVGVEVSGGKSRAQSESLSWSLAAGGTATGCVRIPFAAIADADAKILNDADPKVWLERTTAFWKGLLGRGTRIVVPCEKATDALRAAHVCQFIANDRGAVHGGEGFYDEFYLRDGAYQLLQLEEAGFDEAARKAVEPFLTLQKPDGRFESQDNQLDGNGQALWTLWQYGKITADPKWLERVYPQMLTACRWTMKARREAAAAAEGGAAFAGLLPAAFADGEYLYDRKHHIVGYDLWNLRGLLCTADVARTLGKADEADELTAEAHAYRKDIDAAVKRAGVDYFPASWEKDGTFWGNTETLWPTALFDVNDPRVGQTIYQARKVHGGGFAEGTIRWVGFKEDAIHPDLSSYTTMASLIRGEAQQVADDFYWYLLHSTAAHAFPEGIHPQRQFAWADTIPHGTGASNYAVLLRHMLVHESGNDLHLLTAVPDGWLDEGNEIRVENAPTHFGPVSFVVRGGPAGVDVEMTGKPPRLRQRGGQTREGGSEGAKGGTAGKILVHLPKTRRLLHRTPGLEPAERAIQTERWDWQTVVKKYRETRKTP